MKVVLLILFFMTFLFAQNTAAKPGGSSGNLLPSILALTSASENRGLSYQVNSNTEVKNDSILGFCKGDLKRSRLGESPLNNLICDAMIEVTQADFSIINFSSIHADLKSGPITHSGLLQVLPFNDSLLVFPIKGEQLKLMIESKLTGIQHGVAIGGGRIEFDPTRKDENKVTYFEVGGFPVYPLKDYRVAIISNYMIESSELDTLLHTDEINIESIGILLRDAVSKYIQNHSPLENQLDNRWIRK
jgi:2',3'-cyclic-nucleotide 2'-phosphodiesterase (5'-nucleotidase family)